MYRLKHLFFIVKRLFLSEFLSCRTFNLLFFIALKSTLSFIRPGAFLFASFQRVSIDLKKGTVLAGPSRLLREEKLSRTQSAARGGTDEVFFSFGNIPPHPTATTVTFSFNGDVNPFVRFADISPGRGIASRRRQGNHSP